MRPDRAVDVRRLRVDEAALFRTLRLRALADAPDAFAHTHDHIRTKPGAYWEEMTLTTASETDLVARVTALTRGWSI